ncbi:MAG: histidine kinase N-terminal 7TM domain-containing protein [Acidimicrobiia bacterium]
MQPHPFTFVYLVSAAFSLTVARTMWRRTAPGASTPAALMVAMAVWSAGYACELASTSQSAQLAWAPVLYLGILFAPLAWLVFALRFTGRDTRLTRPLLAGLRVIPITLYLLKVSDPWHHLVYRNVETVRDGRWLVLQLTYGPAGWANVAYAYVSLAAGAGVILSAFWVSPRIYRRQVTALLMAAAAPWLVNAVYQLGLGPVVDLTPIGFTLTGVGTAWAIRKAQLLDLVPVARGLVVESLADGVAVLDRQDRLIDANAALSRIVGPVVIGDPVSTAFAGCPELLAQLNGGPASQAIASSSDATRHYEPGVTPLTDRRGRQIGRVVTFRDVTERRQVIAELARARDAAEDLARVKSEFLATVSHEIRTPMNGVIGMTALLLDTGLDSQQRAYVEVILTSGGQLLSITNDILDFSKADAGQLNVEALPYEPRVAVASAVNMLKPQATEKNLALTLSVGAAVPSRCAGDEFRVRQIVTNLVSNAIKFTPSGSVAVSIDADPPQADGEVQRLRLSVTDTGIGIPADQIGRLFRPFSQVDASVARRFGGTGLGLAICRGLAELMGGAIAVESEPGRGSTFRVDWQVKPLAATSADDTRPSAPQQVAPLPPTRILVAEDNPVNQVVVLHMLRRLGLTADIARDGEEAVAAVSRAAYDLILMDVQMPNVDGLTATRRIRAINTAQPRIIAMTANAMAGDRELCLAAGMDDYLSKPVDLESLGAVLARNRRILTDRPAEDQDTDT